MNKEETTKSEGQPQQEKPKMREIIIQTDGNSARIVKADVAGGLELRAILQGLLQSIK